MVRAKNLGNEFILTPVLILACNTICFADVPNRNYLQEGMQALAARQYKLAEADFKIAVLEKPGDAIAHYHYANALVLVKRHNAAIEEYQRSYRLDPHGEVSAYCRKALLSYKTKRPEVEVPIVEPISATARIGVKSPAGPLTVRSSGPEVIRSQAESEKQRHQKIGEYMSDAMVRTGDARARKIEETANVEIDRILHGFTPLPPRGSPFTTIGEYQKNLADQVKRDASESAKMERTVAAEHADAYKRWSLQRQNDLDESASNLSSLLHSKPLPGGAILREAGTGFYVRNYDVDTNPLREVHRGVARIIQNSVPLHSSDAQTDVPAEPVGTVRGTVIK